MFIENDDDFGAILNCAVRYAMGRCSYMPSLVVRFITPLLPYLDDKTLNVFTEDYIYQEKYGNPDFCFGDPKIDRPVWDAFYASVNKELEERRRLHQ